MNRIVRTQLAGLALLAAGATALAAPAVTIGNKAPAEGHSTTQTAKQSMEMSMEVSVGGNVVQNQDSTQNQSIGYKLTVLETDASGPSKVQIEYLEHTTHAASGPMEQTMEADFLEDVFVATRGEDGVTITYDDGGKPDDATLSQVRGQLTRPEENVLYDPTMGLSKILSQREIEEGETIDVPKDQANALLGGSSAGVTTESMKLTLQGEEEVDGKKVAIFDVALDMRIVPPDVPPPMQMSLTGDMAGTLRVFVDSGWVQSMNLEGPLTVKGGGEQGGMKIEFSGEAKTRNTATATYSRG